MPARLDVTAPVTQQFERLLISFADGHAVTHKWLTPPFQSPATVAVDSSQPNNADYIWLMQNTTAASGGAAAPIHL